jgi:cell division control protein 6
MSDRKNLRKDCNISGKDCTEELIESLHTFRKDRAILINPDYLDDEKLPEEERSKVLNEIFNRNIRKKQLSRIISHLTPILDNACPPSALIYGPTGSGKTVSLIHVLSTFCTKTQYSI